jgi:hypothetical protein
VIPADGYDPKGIEYLKIEITFTNNVYTSNRFRLCVIKTDAITNG